MASHWFDWRNAAVHYCKSGWGDPLLLLHDLYGGASSEDFDRNVRFLNNHFTVYRLDLVGFGLSDGRAIRYCVQHYTDLIGDFARHVIEAPAHVTAVGHSCGFIAAAAADSPENFLNLVLISPEVSAGKSSKPKLGSKLLREAFRLAIVAPPMRSLFRQVMAGEWEQEEFFRRTVFDPRCVDPSKLERLEELAREPHALPAYASLETGFLTTRLEDSLPRVMNPVRFICGSECDSQYIHNLERSAMMVERGDIRQVQKARLWPHYEQPRQTNQLLGSFLNGEDTAVHASPRPIAA
jgi:pimeloyl-ACP methyl ester carboxylesterase